VALEQEMTFIVTIELGMPNWTHATPLFVDCSTTGTDGELLMPTAKQD
jgi:hypothetical protein